MGKRPYKKNRFITYFIATLLFFLVTFIFIISAIGYDIEFKDGKFLAKRTGAIIVSTRPGDARLYIDGKKYKSNSPLFKLFTLTVDKLPPGTHSLKIEKEGFENFEGEYNIEPSRVAWAVNLILVSQDRESKPFNLNGNVVQEIENRDHSKVLVVTENPESKIVTFNEINQNSKEQTKIAEQVMVAGESWRVQSYSYDGDRILAVKTKENVASYYIFDSATNGRVYSISDQLPNNVSTLTFNPRNRDELYLIREGNAVVLNYLNKNLGTELAQNVTAFYATSLGMLATIRTETGVNLSRIDTNGTVSQIIKELPVSKDYQIDYSASLDRYIVLPRDSKKLGIYYRSNGSLNQKEIAVDVEWFSLTPATNFLFYKSGKNFFTHDIDRGKTCNSLKEREPSSVSWFVDEVNMIYSENSKIKLITREGFYDKFLFDTEKDFPVFVSQNSDNIFFTAKNNTKNTIDLFVYTLNY